MRDVQSEYPIGIQYRIHETPADLAVLTDLLARQQKIWIDTETADWNTSSPRLSLVQLRLENGSIHVIDVLSDEMAAVYKRTFVPRVIAAPHIEKWAHYARFERQVFGPDLVQGLNCTLELARSVPYHRLPLRSLTLATLVHHFFGKAIDKSFQRADWGHRPLSDEELDYAAWDPEWCYRIHERLRQLSRSWNPETDDPKAIQSEYVRILPAERHADRWRTAIWDAIKVFMVAEGRQRFADFAFQKQIRRRVPIRALAGAVVEVDPLYATEFAVAVPTALRESLRPGGEAALRQSGHETITTRFLGPRAPRVMSRPSYAVDPDDPNRVAAEYKDAYHKHRALESECQELKARMRALMDHRRLRQWGDFKLTDGASRLTCDVRTVVNWLRDGQEPFAGLPAKFLPMFTERQLQALSQYVYETNAPILRWWPDPNAVPLEMEQSRESHYMDEVE